MIAALMTLDYIIFLILVQHTSKHENFIGSLDYYIEIMHLIQQCSQNFGPLPLN